MELFPLGNECPLYATMESSFVPYTRTYMHIYMSVLNEYVSISMSADARTHTHAQLQTD